MPNATAREARIITHYLLRRPVTDTVADLYISSVRRNAMDQYDRKLLTLMLRFPFTVGLVDAGLAFYRPHSEVRRRIYIMLAILESSPDYCDSFLPKNRSLLYLPVLLYVGARGVLRTAVGSVVVRLVA